MKRLLALGAAGLAGAALTGCSLLEDSGDSNDSSEVSNEQFDAAADATEGDCLPLEMVGGDGSEFAVDCSDPEAYWSITAITGDTDATASGGDLTDHQAIFDMCGEEVGAYLPGEPLTDWNMIYDQTSGDVDYLFCVESLSEPDEEGVAAVVPTTGDCFGSSDIGATVPCESEQAEYTVLDVVEMELAEHDEAGIEEAAADCGQTAYFDLTDQFGRTGALLCVE
ncbi:hypothetical protein [Glycomyces xiaoerkulensis]|uniref:hypothetical protein n=1 Tax=Glycomyces xiaoerkulensis TaxID=2038139 RepID=UPI000C26B0A4|nr:hypothetical protein [Glycomyces xiaoerkulensis]